MRKTRKEIADEIWESKYLLAKQFYYEHKHLLIPDNYIVKNIKLGKWIKTQREYFFKNNNSFFNQDRIEKLNKIKMVWDCKEYFWAKMYKEIVLYKKEFGNIRVPQSYVTKNGLKLGIWLNTQRKSYKNKKLINEKRKKLVELGIIWNPKNTVRNQWYVNYKEVVSYKKKYNCFPKVSYISSSGVKLGYWLSSQRTKYKKQELPLEREIKLKRIGVLNNFTEEKWEDNYKSLKNFYKKYGHTNLSEEKDYDKKLAKWVYRQKLLYKKNKLSKLKIEKLEKIKIVWKTSNDHWDKMYEKAVKFYNENSTLYISKNKNTSKDYKLATWLETQRRMYHSNNSYSVERIKKLNEIKMPWDLYKSPEEIWNEWYIKAKKFYEANHHLTPSHGKLRTWIFAQRAAKKGLRGKISDEQIKLLDDINMIWDIRNNNWDKMYKYAKEYYNIHELLNIPVNYITSDGVKLGIWIARQRNVYKDIIRKKIKANNIINKRIKLLNKIGMIWDASTIITKTSFQEKAVFYYLKKFFKDVKKVTQWEFIGFELDVYIPSIKTAIEYDGICHIDKLDQDNRKNKACKKHGIRIIRIRDISLPKVSNCKDIINIKSCKDSDLEDAINELFNLLNIEYICNINKDKNAIIETYKDYSSPIFDRNYEKAYLISKKYGPISSKKAYCKLDKQLSYWITEQRHNYKHKLLTPLQIKKLKKIGIVLNLYENSWNEKYKHIISYYKMNGNLNIPSTYITNNGVHLGAWLHKQKKLYKKGNLSECRIKLLEKLDKDCFFYKPHHKILNQKKKIYIDALKNYYNKHGNIDIKGNYINKEGIKLGKWLARKKALYKKGALNNELTSLFKKLKIKLNYHDEKWDEIFEKVKNYYMKNGNILISGNYVAPDGTHLGDWISRQRQKYFKSEKYKPLTKDQINKLNSIKMIWDPYKAKWMKNYELAKAYYKKNGHLNIPINYISKDGVKLGMWISVQRQANRGNPNFLMTPERKKLLNEINMNWEIKHPHPNAKSRKFTKMT